MIKTTLFRAAFRWLPLLPMRLVQWVAIGASVVVWAMAGSLRARVRANLAHIPALAADPVALQQTTRRAFRSLLLNYVDLFMPPPADAVKKLTINDLSLFRELREQGTGCVVLSLHSSGFEWGCYFMPQLMGPPLIMPAEVVQPKELFDLLAAERAKCGIEFLPIDQDATLRAMITAVRQGGKVMLACDRDVLHTGLILPFFGAPARLPSGPIALARLTGVPVIFATSWRVSLDAFEGRAFKGVDHIARDTRGDEAVRRVYEPIIALMEREIARRPDQWLAAFTNDVWIAPASVATAQPASVTATAQGQ